MIGLDAFMTAANLGRHRQLNGNPGIFRISDGRIIRYGVDGEPKASLGRPPAWQQPDFSAVDIFRRAMA